jgi:signal transduction histidine kinase
MYRHEFDRVLWSLVLHAASLCAEGRTLRLATATVTPHVDAPSAKPFLTLAVTAEGAGLDANAQSQLFDLPADARGVARATTVSPSKEGLLSLSRARRLLDDAGGDLSIHSETGTGTTFTAWLPAVPVVGSDRSLPKDAGDGAVPGGR